MSRRNGSMPLNLSLCSGLPMNTIGPCEEISLKIARPSVVLPEPDSPTTPSVSPLRTSMVTPSTALMWPTVLRSTPRLIGLRLGGEQRLGVGMLGRYEDALDRALLDDLALLHDTDLVGNLADNA